MCAGARQPIFLFRVISTATVKAILSFKRSNGTGAAATFFLNKSGGGTEAVQLGTADRHFGTGRL
jgi:hypothetical protein